MTDTVTRPPRWTTYLLLVLAAVVAVILVGAGLVAWVGHGLSRHAPRPDVAAYAQSASVRHTDAAMATWFSGQLSQLGRHAPWLRPAGQAVDDQCTALPVDTGIGGPASWTMNCTRIQAGYFAYAGRGSSRVAALERALSQLGWAGFTRAPGSLDADYTTTQSPVPKVGLRATWLSPATPAAVQQLAAQYTRAFGQPKAGTAGLLQAIPPDPRRLGRAATGPDDNLFIVTLQGTYATSPASS